MNLTYEQILAMFTTRRNVPVVRPMTIHTKRCPSIEEESKGLDEDLVPLYHSIFRRDEEQKELNIRGVLPFKEVKTAMPVCNKLFKMNEAVYRCYDCTIHEAAVLCITCFERGSHQGHRFGKMQSGGGNCDCGNPDAILPQGFCVDHKGTADEVQIQPKVNEAFDHHFKQIFIWILQLYKLELKTESENLLIHLLEVLDELNTESLFYNTLTNTFLFANDNQVADHILIMGTKAKDGPISKKATELFLKMFSLEVFKENMALLYLKAYNKLANFQHTRFQSLFIQLFANNDLVEKVIGNSGISLDPRERTYTANSYYSNLVFIGSIKERAARVFYTPIIKNGGVDCNILEDMESSCEHGSRKPEEIYSETINTQNIYYSVNKTILKIIKDSPELVQKQIENQYRQILKYSFKKNKIVLIYQRVFVMYVFVYFKCDYDRIDIDELCRILKIDMVQMKAFLGILSRHFINCLKEYGRCIGYVGPGQYGFENYVDLYVRSANGNRIIICDMIGIKFCAIAHEKIRRIDNFAKVFLDCYQEESKQQNMVAGTEEEWQSDSDGQESPKKLKSRQKAVVFFLGWLNTINLIVESLLYDRAELCLINDIQIKDVTFHTDMYENQFKKLMLNVREISMHEIEAMGIFWFNKSIDKAVISKFAAYDKNKKKFTVKEDVVGVPIKRELCKSFTKAPDHFMRASDQLEIQVTDQTRRWREIFFSPTFLHKIYHGLISHLHSNLKKQFQKYLKEIALHLRIINLIFQSDNELLEETIDIVINLAEKNQKLKGEIVALFRTEGRKDSMEENVDKEKMDKRKELLKKKKEEKLKMLKSKINVEKYLNQNNKEEDNENQTCIICHEQNSQSPLFYMASTFLSNITYSVLKTQGINPFFISCFHQVHEKCFHSLVSDVQRVTCPLCKAYTNIILPTEQSIKDLNVLKVSTEKMEVAFALEYKKSFENLYVEIMKSFIQLFFSGAIEEGMINQRQIKIYKIIFDLVKIHYDGLSNEQREALQNGLLAFASKYEKESNEKYNLGLLMDFVFTIALKILKKEAITEQAFKAICQHCKHLPRNDLQNCNNLANKLFDLSNNLTPFFNQSMDIQCPNRQLRSFIYQFDPPKSIRALLQQRRKIEQQKICKMGHPICICLICSWKGCHDCGTCNVHSRQVHNYDCLYFNFITGGFHHQYNKIEINIRSLYVNQLGVPWKPRFQDDAYFFQIDVYQKLSQALRSGNLIQMVRSNYEQLRVRDNGVWII